MHTASTFSRMLFHIGGRTESSQLVVRDKSASEGTALWLLLNRDSVTPLSVSRDVVRFRWWIWFWVPFRWIGVSMAGFHRSGKHATREEELEEPAEAIGRFCGALFVGPRLGYHQAPVLFLDPGCAWCPWQALDRKWQSLRSCGGACVSGNALFSDEGLAGEVGLFTFRWGLGNSLMLSDSVSWSTSSRKGIYHNIPYIEFGFSLVRCCTVSLML